VTVQNVRLNCDDCYWPLLFVEVLPGQSASTELAYPESTQQIRTSLQ
jgi:hypothetical protein